MHGRAGEERKSGRHMWTGPNRVNSFVAGDVSPSSSLLSPANSFCKDGRKISVGDCALFKPPQDFPPFIGIIRWLITGKENELRLCVNWLYRPSELKLGKGILLEAAPNEVFYSFHKDEIPAASLLHPCKVAFLAKGVELPSGISSFVCRQVYDITNKCLWWLTDKDYINEHQEEVDQLLHKTHTEMYATVQPGGRSPKPMNSPTSTSQLKPGSDSVHSSTTSFPSETKGKKRERGDQGSEPGKRERILKMDDGDFGHSRPESAWKFEISKFTEKGGLVDSEGVEKLVQLLQPERSDKKVDLVGRSMLAGVIAATDKFDCLNRFVQLRGLSVFDEWLQEVHKGKIGDSSNPKDNDKSIEEFLLVLLRALDKLPVNLHALKMCNIGKSVNHLRTHKNMEIQKKARSLVDIWKKRVEAEMDAKSGSNQSEWAARQRIPEVSHGGSRHSGAFSEVAVKSSAVQHSASKISPVKHVQGEPTTKSAAGPSASLKQAPSSASVGNNLKEGLSRNPGVGFGSDRPLTTAGDEKSSSSSPSHTNSQSCSSDHGKTAGYSGKEDARSSTAVSMASNMSIGGGSEHCKSTNGFPGPTSSVFQKEIVSSRNSSVHRNASSEKLPESSLTCEKVVDVPVAEGNSHKLIVKLSTRGRSPARSASGGSFEDPSIMNSRASSPVLLEKHDQFDRNVKEKNNICRVNVISDVNAESWQSNDFKEVLTGSDEGDVSPATGPDEDNSRTGNDSRKLPEVSKGASSSSGNEHKSVKLHEASSSSMNALIESCMKCSEAIVSISGADNIGMNLLASVAAGEMSKLETASPSPSPQRNATTGEYSCSSTGFRIKSSPGDNLAPEQVQPVDDEQGNWGSIVSNIPTKNTEDMSMGELSEHLNSSSADVQQVVEPGRDNNVKSEEKVTCASLAMHSAGMVEKSSNVKGIETGGGKSCGTLNESGLSHAKEELGNSFDRKDKVDVSGVVGTDTAVGSFPCLETDSENKTNTHDLKINVQAPQKQPTIVHSDCTKGHGEMLRHSDSGKDVISENGDKVKAEKADETDCRNQLHGKQNIEEGSYVTDYKGDCVENSEGTWGNEQSTGGPTPHKLSPAVFQEPELQARSRGQRLTGTEFDEAEECTSAAVDVGPSSAAGESNREAKMEFDLNEGFNGDDGRFGEPNNLKAPECTSGIQLMNPLPVSSSSGGLPGSITVASAAKRPFVPPEDLLKSRGELGWKGSAATSAFRPAEPRKSLDIPVSMISTSLPDVPAAKATRPPLDIDLNVPDERVFEDSASRSTFLATGSSYNLADNHDLTRDESMSSAPLRNSWGLDLDLNRADEPADAVNRLTSNAHRLDVQLQAVKSPSGGIPDREVSARRDFDLNDGPHVDDSCVEPSSLGQNSRSSAPTHSQLPVSTIRISNAEIGNFSSWFGHGNPYSAVTIQSVLPDRGERPLPVVAPGGPQRMLAPTAVTTITPDVYRGPVFSSSPAVPFPSTTFQYPVFSFGPNFPLPSASFSGGSTAYADSPSGGRLCIPALHSQVLGPASAVPSHFTRPFVVGLPDSNNNGGVESSRKWGRQGLDLNAGPLGPDVEGRDETSSLVSRQLSVASSQAITEQQSRMYQIAGGGVLKRKEPDGGWEGYKQSSWQ